MEDLKNVGFQFGLYEDKFSLVLMDGEKVLERKDMTDQFIEAMLASHEDLEMTHSDGRHIFMSRATELDK